MANTSYLEAVIALMALLVDGEKGFSDLAELVDASPCRIFLLEEAFLRASYVAELRAALESTAVAFVTPSSTVPGMLHRRWLELRASLGASDGSMLDSLHQCEHVASLAYLAALEEEGLPAFLRTLLQHQADHVQRALPALLNLCRPAA